MRVANRQQVEQYLRAMGAPPAILAGALGAYGENPAYNPVPPETYGRETFNAPSQAALQALSAPPPIQTFYNANHFTSIFFQIGTNEGSRSILPANSKRNFLLVQNQSTTVNLFFNFAQDAGVNQGVLLAPGVGVFYDLVCPSDTISVFFNNATPQPGLLVEGSVVTQ